MKGSAPTPRGKPKEGPQRIATQFAVTRVLAEAVTLAEAAPKIVQAIGETVGWEVGAIWELDRQANLLRCVDVWHSPSVNVANFEPITRESSFRPGAGLPGRVWSTGKPAWIASVGEDPNLPRAPFAVKDGLRGAFGFPILCGCETVGVLEFFSHEVRKPGSELLEMFGAIGSQIGQFIERRHAEASLKDSERLYHSLLEGLPVMVLRKNLQGRFTFANQRFCAELGKSLAEILGKTDFDFFPPELAAKYQEDDRRVTDTRITFETVEAHVAAGQKFFVQVIKTPVYDGAGNVIGLLGIFWDVTDKHRAEEALEHERYLLHTLMDNLPDFIYFKDRQSRFLRNNRAFLKRFGLHDAQEAIGKTDSDFFTEEHARQAYEDEQQVLRTGQPIHKEEKETWPDGSVTWALSTKLPLRDQKGATIGTFGISRDISDLKRAEEALRLAKDAAEQASRTKSHFLASMSHELRTPLNSVIGFANILLKNKSGNLSASELNFLDRIQANGKHLLALINQILDLSKIEAGKVELQVCPVALDALVRETVAQQEGLVRDRPVQLLTDLPGRVSPLHTDPDKLKQIIINLIGNALKFTERGSVTVRVATDPADHRPVRIDVVDTGIGIPQEKLGLIFEAFQQADAGTARKYGGTGLGLTISQALCQLMNYRIEVASELGKGSTFSIILSPGLKPQAERGPASASPKPSPAALRGHLVLVIDDEEDSRILLTHLVEDCGCRVITADSGEQALRRAREVRPDLITLDLMMPRMSGWEVLGAIKADLELRDIPVVVVSVAAEENGGRVLGAVDVLRKPVAREDLLAVLQRNLPMARPRILVVDDEPDARHLILSHLEDEPVEIRAAVNGRDALDIMETFFPDVVLLDLMMPVMDGFTFLNAVRADPRYQRLRVVVVTAKELTPAESEQLRQQTLHVLQKADAFGEDLKKLLRTLLQASSPRFATP
jgi:PAS domain S-box-containing protein